MLCFIPSYCELNLCWRECLDKLLNFVPPHTVSLSHESLADVTCWVKCCERVKASVGTRKPSAGSAVGHVSRAQADHSSCIQTINFNIVNSSIDQSYSKSDSWFVVPRINLWKLSLYPGLLLWITDSCSRHMIKYITSIFLGKQLAFVVKNDKYI